MDTSTKKKKTRIFLISSVFFLIFSITTLGFGVWDYFNFRKNSLEIVFEPKKVDIPDDLIIKFISGRDTLVVFSNNKITTKSIPDWYGKDHIILSLNGKLFFHSHKTFKFKSYLKTKYKLNVKKISKDKWIINWKVKTLYSSNSGIDFIL